MPVKSVVHLNLILFQLRILGLTRAMVAIPLGQNAAFDADWNLDGIPNGDGKIEFLFTLPDDAA